MGSVQGQKKEGSNTVWLYVRVKKKKTPSEINVILTPLNRGAADIL